MDDHGLLLVRVRGTVYTPATLVGKFEQLFGLAQAPSGDGSWCIKRSRLQIGVEERHGGATGAGVAAGSMQMTLYNT
jgi:hypothetical protein